MESGPYIAALPMYDWPERRQDVDREWADIRDRLRARNIPAPEALIRRNADMPPVPGGIRDRNGALIAPDPAELPPDEFDLFTLWRHPRLLYAQTCYGPMEFGLAAEVSVVADPDYSDVPGGHGAAYTSALVTRRDRLNTIYGMVDGDLPPPSDGTALFQIEQLSGQRLAFNEEQSMSGYLALKRDLEAAGSGLSVFSSLVASGSHRQSMQHVTNGIADIAAIDARTWQMAQTYLPEMTQRLAVIGWTARRPGLPFITNRRNAHVFQKAHTD
ncbi:MAG: hypothetical protein RIR97_849 [Pseudomonadota bacterium]